MSKNKLSSRIVVSRIALFSLIGFFLLVFMAAGTSAAPFSFIDSVREFLGLSATISNPVAPKSSTAATNTSDIKISNDMTLNNYSASPLKLKESGKSAAKTTDKSRSKAKKNGADDAGDDQSSRMTVGRSYHNDTSPPLRDMIQLPLRPHLADDNEASEANKNPSIPNKHIDSEDSVVESFLAPNAMPTPVLNFDGIVFPGVACNCAPPDTNGEVGATQYVQSVNNGYQVFNKTTGVSVLGPSSVASLWAGFGGVCQTGGKGDPIVLYDQIAGRWLISQFAGSGSPATDECIAISTTSDATGPYNRYAFNLGTNFFDYPHIGVWPDGYYMADNVFNAAGTAYLGPQAFAFDRAAMLAGTAATFVTPGITGGPSEAYFLPADLDGSTLPPAGTACPFVSWPGVSGTYKTFLFDADFVTPLNSTFTLRPSPPPAAGFTQLCAATNACVPQLGSANNLADLGDRLMHRLPYRIVGGVERVVGNYSVSSNSVAGVRWFELRNVTSGTETVFQESTYQPDTTWRWMGSVAQDQNGNLALGYSASSASINPQIRYAGRLAGDPINTLAQGEATLFAGTGSQTGTNNRWGDYSAMSIDPVDDCTFWYTQEYYSTTSSFNWRTRIGNFKYPTCSGAPTAVINAGTSPLITESCTPANGVPDPGEIVTFTLNLMNGGTGPTTNLVATLQTSGGVTSPSGPQNYASLPPDNTVVGRNFSFTASGTCGDIITMTLQLQDGATNLGTVTFTKQLGTTFTSTAFIESFDGVTAPALPAGWTTAATGVEVPWVTSVTNSNSAPNNAFAPDPNNIGNTELVTPAFTVAAGGGQVSFRNVYNMESTFDGMVLEISINGGAFADITAGGGGFTSGGYNGTISSSFASPIAGRQAWTGLSGGTAAAPAYITSIANLPAAAAGQSVRLKWRAATDNSVSATGDAGVRVDNIGVSSTTFICSTNCSAPSGTISGAVTYGNPIPFAVRLVSNVALAGAGSPNVSALTGGLGATEGQYTLTGFGAGAYTVTPTKTGGVNGAVASFDAAKIAQHGAGPPLPQLTGNQLLVADVSNNGMITSFDAAMVAKFAAGPPYVAPGIGLTGTWKFVPVNRNYASVANSITGENYSALLLGEVSGNWTNTGARPAGSGPERSMAVKAPHLVTPAGNEVVIPVSVRGAANKGIISYEFNLRYDPTVIKPQANPVDLAGTVSSRLTAVANATEPGLLRVVVYGPLPINGNGVLLNLRFNAVGASGSVSPLTWEQVIFNEGDPYVVVTDGLVELSSGVLNLSE